MAMKSTEICADPLPVEILAAVAVGIGPRVLVLP